MLRFIKKATPNLSQDFNVYVPSKRLPLSEQKRMLAKQLYDFLHIYRKDTEQIRFEIATQLESEKRKHAERLVDERGFLSLLHKCNEMQLEEIMSVYMKKSQDSSVFLGGPVKKSPATIPQQSSSSSSATSTNNNNSVNNAESNDFFLLSAPNSLSNSNASSRTASDTATFTTHLAAPTRSIEIPPLNFGTQSKAAEKLNAEINNQLVSTKKSKLTHIAKSTVHKKDSKKIHKKRQNASSSIRSEAVSKQPNSNSNTNGAANNLNDMTGDEDALSIKSDDASLSDDDDEPTNAPKNGGTATATKLRRKSSNNNATAAKEKKFNPIRAMDNETTITNIYLSGHQKNNSTITSNGGTKLLLNSNGGPKTNPPSRNGQINGFNFVTGKNSFVYIAQLSILE